MKKAKLRRLKNDNMVIRKVDFLQKIVFGDVKSELFHAHIGSIILVMTRLI